MKEYFELPNWVNSIENINSFYMNLLKEKISSIEGKQFDLDILRELYRLEKPLFFKIYDELILRGFSFITQKQNRFFPENHYLKNECLIFVNEDRQRYKDINYSLLDLNGFITRFNVKSDQFFNFVPIKGFLNLNRGTKEELIIAELGQKGFEIKGGNKTQVSKVENKKVSCKKTATPLLEEIKVVDFETLLENPTKTLRNLMGIQIKNFDVHLHSLPLSNRSSWALFRSHIFMLSEFLNSTYNDLRKIRNFGKKSINEVLEIVGKLTTDDLYFETVKNDLIANRFSDIKETDINRDLNFLEINQKLLDILKSFGILTIKHLLYSTASKLLNVEHIGKLGLEEIYNKINLSEIAVFLDNQTISNDLPPSGTNNYHDKEDNKEDDNSQLFNLQSLSNAAYKDESSQLFNLESLANGKYFEHIISEIKFNEREQYCLLKRYVERETLEKIAKSLDVTRERVRQIMVKIDRDFVHKIKDAKFLELIKDTRNGNFIDSKTLKSFLGDYADQYMHYFTHQKFKNFYYLKDLDIFVFNNEKEIRKKFEELQKKLPSLFNLDDYREFFIDFFINMGISNYPEYLSENDLINSSLKKLGYKKYGLYFSIGKLTLYEAVDILFNDFINVPIKYTEENLTHMKSILKTKLGYTNDNPLRGFERVIRENENIILVGKRTYLNKNKIIYDPKALEIAYRYLEEKKEQGKKAVKILDVFTVNEDTYKKYGIENEYVLYSLMKETYSEEFLIGKGNTLKIFFEEDEREKNYASELKKYLQKNNCAVQQKKIEKDLKWDIYTIPSILVHNRCFIKIDNGCIRFSDKYSFNENEKILIDPLLQAELEEHEFISTHKLFEKMNFSNELIKILEENEIDSVRVLARFLKNTYSGLKGRSKVLFEKDSEYKEIDDYIINKYTETHRVGEIQDFLTDIGYNAFSAINKIENLIKRGVFILTAYSEITASEKFIIESSVEDEVLNFIENKYGNQEYLILDNVIGLRKLPKTKFEWNKYTLKHILLSHDYYEIGHHASILQLHKTIIVREEDASISFDKFIADLIKKDYTGNMHEEDIYEYLVNKELIEPLKNQYSKNLPLELKNSELFEINEIGEVKIKVNK